MSNLFSKSSPTLHKFIRLQQKIDQLRGEIQKTVGIDQLPKIMRDATEELMKSRCRSAVYTMGSADAITTGNRMITLEEKIEKLQEAKPEK